MWPHGRTAAINATAPKIMGIEAVSTRATCQASRVKLHVRSLVSASHAGKVYRRRFVSTRLAATLLADEAPCFSICACPAFVIKRDFSYSAIHFSLEIA